MVRAFIGALALGAASSYAKVEVSAFGPDDVVVPGEYIVQFASDADTEFDAYKAAHADDRNMIKTFEYGTFKAFAASLDADELADIQVTAGVQRIEPNTIHHINGEQAGVEAWGIDRIDQPAGLNQVYRWRDDADGTGVEVHVLDTGIDTTHPEFEGRAKFLADCDASVPCETVTDRGDQHSHGTHCAGTIGSKTYGVAKNVTLYSVRVCDQYGGCSQEAILAGFETVVNHPTDAQKIISYSIGGPLREIMNDAANAVHEAGVVMVVAAGNNGANACDFSPSSAENVVSVGSITIDDDKSSFSNAGPCMSLYAPGSNILSTIPNGGTQQMSGTSMATPHVSGAAALIASRPGVAWDADSVIDTLLAEAIQGTVSHPDPDTPNLLLFTSPDGKRFNDPDAY